MISAGGIYLPYINDRPISPLNAIVIILYNAHVYNGCQCYVMTVVGDLGLSHVGVPMVER